MMAKSCCSPADHPLLPEPETACCSCAVTPTKKIMVTYLYLDLTSCDRCIGTDQVLDGVMEVLTPALQLAGYEVDYQKIKMETAAMAEQYAFLSSPTIRVNGRDVLGPVLENECDCCSEISGADVDCRVFEYQGKTYEVPPAEMLAEAILKNAFGPGGGEKLSGGYVLPANLSAFYRGKKSPPPSCCGCGSGCR